MMVCFTAIAAIGIAAAQDAGVERTQVRGMAAVYPWVFDNGNETSRTMAVSTAEEIARKAGYSTVPDDVANSSWNSNNYRYPEWDHLPNRSTIRSYGRAVKADVVLYGTVSWHTRSIWVDAGPRTVSTATVAVNVLDVRTGRIVYTKHGVGRSDEDTNNVKLAADILLTPLVTAVSGGPATPQEQRAVQVALGRAYRGWIYPQGNVQTF